MSLRFVRIKEQPATEDFSPSAHAVKSKRHQRSHVLPRTPNTSAIDSHDAAFIYTLRDAKPCSLHTAVHGIEVWTEGGEA
ncbi:hypothetical protein C4D60_Mb09t08410 [Musa balbisiana]|uniref:Uncharacterized protein n=1 Tax=Musa balbisiana TaxID=52838 RepID=A0A4S8IHD0_MUSBA|nr:hypothetical protein C4D60_Mb09t08410 [Musa balbisiana]